MVNFIIILFLFSTSIAFSQNDPYTEIADIIASKDSLR